MGLYDRKKTVYIIALSYDPTNLYNITTYYYGNIIIVLVDDA